MWRNSVQDKVETRQSSRSIPDANALSAAACLLNLFALELFLTILAELDNSAIADCCREPLTAAVELREVIFDETDLPVLPFGAMDFEVIFDGVVDNVDCFFDVTSPITVDAVSCAGGGWSVDCGIIVFTWPGPW